MQKDQNITENLSQPWFRRGFHFCRPGRPSAQSPAVWSVASAAAPESAISVAETHRRRWKHTTYTKNINNDNNLMWGSCMKLWMLLKTQMSRFILFSSADGENCFSVWSQKLQLHLKHLRLLTCSPVSRCSPSAGPDPAPVHRSAPVTKHTQWKSLSLIHTTDRSQPVYIVHSHTSVL